LLIDRCQRTSQRRWGRSLVWLALLLAWPMRGQAITQGSFAAVRYRLEVAYNPAARTIYGQIAVRLTWRGSQPLTALYFFLPPNTLSRRDRREPAAFSDLRYPRGFSAAGLTVHQVTDGVQWVLPFRLQDDQAVLPGRVPDQALLHVTLPRPYEAGERIKVTMSFSTRLPVAKNWGVYRGVVALDGLWYPTLVPYRQGKWIWGMQEFVHAHYTLRLTTDAEQQVVASVPWSERTQSNGRQMLSGSADSLYHLGLSSSARWYSEDDTSSSPTLRVLVPPGDAPRAESLLRTLRNALTFYRQHFGFELPGPTFTVVVHERDLSWPFSTSADNLLLLSRDLVRVPDLTRRLAEYFVARGLAQQWWGLRTAYNLNTERWTGEGLATYWAFQWLESQYGSSRNFLTWKGVWLPNISYREQSVDIQYRRLAVNEIDQRMRTPVAQTRDRQNLRFIYEKKGAMVYAMLEDLLGQETFHNFLHLLATEYGGSVMTTEGVQHAAEAVSSKDLAWFFQQWVAQRAKLDYAVGNVEVMPQTDASGATVYVNRVEIRRLREAVMPMTVRLLASDGSGHDVKVDGQARSEMVTWQSAAPLSDVQIDPDKKRPDVQRLNNTSRLPYAVRPLIDFPRLDRLLFYPWITLDNNFIDGYVPRLVLVAQYLDDLLAAASVGYKTDQDAVSVEASILRRRFPIRDLATSLNFTDRLGARNISLVTNWLMREYRQQYLMRANLFTLGYRISFLEAQNEFRGEPVPADIPTTGRINSFVLGYQRDTRVPGARGLPTGFAEPLAYGYVLRLELELASDLIGSEFDMQQVRLEATEFLRVWHQGMLRLRIFGGWTGGTVALQRKLSLAGPNTVRAYPRALEFLGDRMLGWNVGLRFPLWRDIRLEDPWRFLGIRSLHIGPFVDGGWVWDTDQDIGDVSLRYGAGLRLVLGMGFFSVFRFEVVVDVAYPLDELGRKEGRVQTWFRLQTTTRGGRR
jgi:hypothetical protein